MPSILDTNDCLSLIDMETGSLTLSPHPLNFSTFLTVPDKSDCNLLYFSCNDGLIKTYDIRQQSTFLPYSMPSSNPSRVPSSLAKPRVRPHNLAPLFSCLGP